MGSSCSIHSSAANSAAAAALATVAVVSPLASAAATAGFDIAVAMELSILVSFARRVLEIVDKSS